jgi:hypothetical protein
MTPEPAELKEIRRRNNAAARGNLRRWEATRNPYARWWLERHTMTQIHELCAIVPEPAHRDAITDWFHDEYINGDGIHINRRIPT